MMMMMMVVLRADTAMTRHYWLSLGLTMLLAKGIVALNMVMDNVPLGTRPEP